MGKGILSHKPLGCLISDLRFLNKSPVSCLLPMKPFIRSLMMSLTAQLLGKPATLRWVSRGGRQLSGAHRGSEIFHHTWRPCNQIWVLLSLPCAECGGHGSILAPHLPKCWTTHLFHLDFIFCPKPSKLPVLVSGTPSLPSTSPYPDPCGPHTDLCHSINI